MGVASSLSFDGVLAREGLGRLRRAEPQTLQVNVGKRCNQACHHCHVDAGPKRTEVMTAATAERVLEVLERNPGLRTMDVTGGAPELNPSFRRLVEAAPWREDRALQPDDPLRRRLEMAGRLRAAGRARLLAAPCHSADNVDKQRATAFRREHPGVQR